MPDLLLELFSEEIPARMQARAAEDLRKLVTDRLVDAGLVYEGAKAFVTPRRLALAVQGVPVRQPDVKEEKKGPRVGAPGGSHRGLRARRRAQVDRRGQGSARQEGRLLRGRDREAGPAGDRSDRRDRARGGDGVSLAQVDALGRAPQHCSAKRRFHCHTAGAIATEDWIHGCGRCIPSSPPSGRRPRSPRSSLRGRRHQRRQQDARPSLHGAAAVQGAAARRTTPPSWKRPRSCSTPSGAGRSSSPMPRTSPSPRATSWWRTRASWPRSPGWSNGRSC